MIIKKILLFLFKAVRKAIYSIVNIINSYKVSCLFYLLNVKHKKYITRGVPFISIGKNGRFEIGDSFKMNNRLVDNPIGRAQKCIFNVGENAYLLIGDNVGMSHTAINCQKGIKIGNNVMIGGGVCIYDTDFHSLKAELRNVSSQDKKYALRQEIIIQDNVFIGANSTILKGVEIGFNSIIGASSVVTKSIGPNEIWAGNPAKFIKKISN